MTKVAIAAAVAAALYILATRTCRGRAVVARIRGLAPVDCGCGCTDTEKQPVSASPLAQVIDLELGAADGIYRVSPDAPGAGVAAPGACAS